MIFNDNLKNFDRNVGRSPWQDTIYRLKIEYQNAVSTLQSELKGKEAKAEEMMDAFKNFRRKIAMKAVYSKSGKLLNSKDIDRMEATDIEKKQQVEKARLITIKTNLQTKKIERKLLSKEKLAQGLDIIGFEQFQLENKKLRRRRDEREKELQQFLKKREFLLSSIEQAEKKLSQMVEDSERKERKIKECELSISKKKRELLMYKKRFKNENNSGDGNALSAKAHKQLIKDYEQSKIEEAKGLQYLATLKKRHFELSRSTEDKQDNIARSLQDFIPIADDRNKPTSLDTINL